MVLNLSHFPASLFYRAAAKTSLFLPILFSRHFVLGLYNLSYSRETSPFSDKRSAVFVYIGNITFFQEMYIDKYQVLIILNIRMCYFKTKMPHALIR